MIEKNYSKPASFSCLRSMVKYEDLVLLNMLLKLQVMLGVSEIKDAHVNDI